MAVYLINENRKLREDFSASFPEWLLRKLRGRGYNNIKSALGKRNIDLNRASFIEADPPTSNRDPMLKDPDKIPIFLLNDGTIYSPKLPSTGDQYVTYYQRYADASSPGSRQSDYIKNLSWKKILDMTDQFGYIDATDASNFNQELKQQRQQAKAGITDRHGHGQYRSPIYGKKQTDWGERTDYDNIVGYKWLTKSGYDKSGYPLDPEKYVRMLNELNMDNYAMKLRKYYTAIKGAQSDLAKAVTSADIDNRTYRGKSHWGNNVMSDIKDAADSLERAITEYRNLQERVERIANHEDWDDAKKNRFLQDGWGTSGKRLYDYLKEFDQAVQAINANASYEEED